MSKKKNIEEPILETVVEPEFQCCGKDECLDCPLDALKVETTEKPIVVAQPKLDGYIVKDGDSWASISAENVPSGFTKHEYAKRLIELNGNKTLRPGAKVIL